MNNTKPWYASVTFWLNVIGAITTFLTGFTDTFGAQYPQAAAVIAIIFKGLNLIRRFLDPNQPSLTLTDKRSI